MQYDAMRDGPPPLFQPDGVEEKGDFKSIGAEVTSAIIDNRYIRASRFSPLRLPPDKTTSFSFYEHMFILPIRQLIAWRDLQ